MKQEKISLEKNSPKKVANTKTASYYYNKFF